MPCGGIYPIAGHYSEPYWTPDLPCFYCQEGVTTHFIEEFDAFLHGRCITPFLATPEGTIITDHMHEVRRW